MINKSSFRLVVMKISAVGQVVSNRPSSIWSSFIMKLITLLVTSLAAVGLASPVAVPEADDISPRDDGHGLFARGSPQVCRVVNASVVNCRLGAGTNYRVVATVKKGDLFVFECVVKGQCVTVGGSTNWYVTLEAIWITRNWRSSRGSY